MVLFCFGYEAFVLHEGLDSASNFVAGHVICGVGFITACVATTATASTRFTLIPANSERTDQLQPADAFNSSQGYILIAIATLMALACLFLSAFLFEMASLYDAYFVPARVLAGLGGICFTLFSIVSILESVTSK